MMMIEGGGREGGKLYHNFGIFLLTNLLLSKDTPILTFISTAKPIIQYKTFTKMSFSKTVPTLIYKDIRYF